MRRCFGAPATVWFLSKDFAADFAAGAVASAGAVAAAVAAALHINNFHQTTGLQVFGACCAVYWQGGPL